MPVGIPKVPFLGPDDEDASWVDLYHRLFHQRLLFLGQEIKSEISNQIVGLMVYLNLVNSNEDIYLFINSPGGGVFSGIAIFDTMQMVGAEVQTVCVGVAASMASLVLVGGEITKRLAFPHAWRQWFLFVEKKKKTMSTPILSKKSMALWVRYAKIIFFFSKPLDYISKE